MGSDLKRAPPRNGRWWKLKGSPGNKSLDGSVKVPRNKRINLTVTARRLSERRGGRKTPELVDLPARQATKKTPEMARHRDDHNRETLEYLEAESIDACLADTRFKDGKEPAARNERKDKERFTQSELTIDRDGKTCRCPARACAVTQSRARLHWPACVMPVQAYEKDCAQLRPETQRCLKTNARPTPRQINVALDTRPGTVEPISGHVTDAMASSGSAIEANAGWMGKGSR